MNTAELTISIRTAAETPAVMEPYLTRLNRDLMELVSNTLGSMVTGIKIRIMNSEGVEIFPKGMDMTKKDSLFYTPKN